MGDWSTNMLMKEENFGFGFNDKDFSDRILHIEIIPEDSLPPKTKKCKLTSKADSNDSNSCVGADVESLHINSLLLAAKSPFFYKLFKNGMMESQQRDATLKISYSEKAAVMDLLRFLYSNTLSASTSSDLLDVLLIADKFQVTSCTTYCIQSLLKLPVSIESVISYFELPCTILAAELVQPLIDASKQYLAAHYMNFNMFLRDAMQWPLPVIEFLLGSDNLQVESENTIYMFILAWGNANYPELEERKEILTKRLSQHIRFGYMSCSKLKEVLACAEFDHEDVNKLVVEALFFKLSVPYGRHNTIATKGSFRSRLYTARPVKAVHLDSPCPSCVIYFNLKRQDCENLPLFRIFSEPFVLDGHQFYLGAECKRPESSSPKFCVYLILDDIPKPYTFDYEVSVRMKPLKQFESQCKVNSSDLRTNGSRELFHIPWLKFMGRDSDYFINGSVHRRFEFM